MELVDVAACYRLTKLAIDDEIAAPIRSRIFARFNPDEGSKVGYLFTCPWCISFHIGLGIVAVRRFAPKQWQPVAEILAMSAVTGWVSQHEG